MHKYPIFSAEITLVLLIEYIFLISLIKEILYYFQQVSEILMFFSE